MGAGRAFDATEYCVGQPSLVSQASAVDYAKDYRCSCLPTRRVAARFASMLYSLFLQVAAPAVSPYQPEPLAPTPPTTHLTEYSRAPPPPPTPGIVRHAPPPLRSSAENGDEGFWLPPPLVGWATGRGYCAQTGASHGSAGAWRSAQVASGWEYLVVLEDDVRVPAHFREKALTARTNRLSAHRECDSPLRCLAARHGLLGFSRALAVHGRSTRSSARRSTTNGGRFRTRTASLGSELWPPPLLRVAARCA